WPMSGLPPLAPLFPYTTLFRSPPAAADDDLTKTVHYGVVAEEVVAVVEGEPVDLVETLAERIAQVCLKHEVVQEVEVCVHKPEAPITVPFDDVTVTINRSRV